MHNVIQHLAIAIGKSFKSRDARIKTLEAAVERLEYQVETLQGDLFQLANDNGLK